MRLDPQAGRYRHEAFFYAGIEEFAAGTLQFLRDGVAEDAAMLVVVGPEKIERLRAELGADAGAVEFRNMAEVGRNPARIIPAWREWVDSHAGSGRPLRGIGEPVGPDRRLEELSECHRHEALLNVAFGTEPFWLLCPYDVSALEQSVVAEARRTHPWWIEAVSFSRPFESDDYIPVDEALPFGMPLSPLADTLESVPFADGGMRTVREAVARAAASAGLSSDRTWDLVLAVNELATNSIRHGGGRGVLRVAVRGDQVVCEVEDAGCIRDPLIGRLPPPADRPGGRGLWIANQLCDLVQVHSNLGGTTVRLFMRA